MTFRIVGPYTLAVAFADRTEQRIDFEPSCTVWCSDRSKTQHTRDARNARTAAHVHFETTLASGLAAVRKLDVLIPNRLKDDPVTLAVWERDRRVEYPTRGKGAATLPAAPPVGSTPAVNPTLPVSSTPTVPDEDAA